MVNRCTMTGVKRILIAYNPVSGRGRASQFATAIAAELVQHPCDVEMCPTQSTEPSKWFLPLLQSKPDTVIAVGGDGTLRQIASMLVETSIPVYHAASGTENLFAKSLSLSTDPETIAATIMNERVKKIDTAIANDSFMLLMGSVGFDADVVARLAESRGTSITHFSYAVPILKTFLYFSPPTISIDVDGTTAFKNQRGFAVVANSRAYARGLNPAKDAIIDDGLLDVVFLPIRTRLQFLKWIGLMKKGTHLHHQDAVQLRGESVTVSTSVPEFVQLDGDSIGKQSKVTYTAKKHSLCVLE